MKTTAEILTKIGVTQLNPMQEATIDAITHTSKDLMVLSPTGSGKTLAYLLPLTQMLDADSDELQAVVIVPGRELALQSVQVLQGFGSGLRGYACYGGRPTMDEHRQLRQVKPQIVFATPGRLNDHLDKQNLHTDQVRWIVLDEFDKCLEMGFHDEMERLISRLPRCARQILLSRRGDAEPGYTA